MKFESQLDVPVLIVKESVIALVGWIQPTRILFLSAFTLLSFRPNWMPFPDKITERCARRFTAIHFIRCRCRRRRHIHRIIPVIKPFSSFFLSFSPRVFCFFFVFFFLIGIFRKLLFLDRVYRIQCNVTNDLFYGNPSNWKINQVR